MYYFMVPDELHEATSEGGVEKDYQVCYELWKFVEMKEVPLMFAERKMLQNTGNMPFSLTQAPWKILE